jgi:hypothetical protein
MLFYAAFQDGFDVACGNGFHAGKQRIDFFVTLGERVHVLLAFLDVMLQLGYREEQFGPRRQKTVQSLEHRRFFDLAGAAAVCQLGINAEREDYLFDFCDLSAARKPYAGYHRGYGGNDKINIIYYKFEHLLLLLYILLSGF